MNILFYVGGYNFYGSERKLLTIMKGLKARGHKVHCITNGWSDGVFNRMLSESGIPYSTSKLGFIYFKKIGWTLDTLIHYPGAVYHHLKTARKIKPDIVYHNNYRAILMLAPFIFLNKNIYHVGDVSVPNFRNKLVFKWVQSLSKLFIASSQHVKQNLQELGIKERLISVVMNGIESFPKFKKVNSEKFRIGIVGQVIPRKGHAELVEAIHLINQSGCLEKTKFECQVYGTGDELFVEYLKSKIEEYNLTPFFRFLGYQKDKIEIFKNLDLVVVPSHYEAFGFSAVEPAFCKIPVIASDTGGLREIVVDGETGLLCRPQNAVDLAAKLKTVLMDATKHKEMGDTAYRHAQKWFTSERMITEIEKILQTI